MPVPITLQSPLPSADLRFESMSVTAGLSVLGEMELGLVSDKPDLKPEDLLGKPLTVSVNLRDDAKRHFHGYVTRFGIGPRQGRYFGYRASVRPWLWFLTRTADCRIFQDLSVPDIVKAVFHDHPSANFEFKLFRTYRKWTYCVQYRETDYNFVARLLEHEGIYWYVEQGDGTGKLVLVDSQSAHDAAPGCDPLPYYENPGETTPDTECVSHWQFASEVESDKVALTSYDFERPSTSLKAASTKAHKYALPELEMFDFQGDYVQAADGTQWSEDRLDEHQSAFQVAQGGSNAHGIEVGHLLGLTKHPRADQNGEYLVTETRVHARVDAYESSGEAGSFRCDFSAIPSGQQFRPVRRTPKPFVQGPQTALVVGPGGEEIFTDKYGRVKVQFHWDRLGKKNEKSSCWVRVSHPWAGKNFGAIHIPRIGQEVVVDFLEGDPDQPLVTGRVYNAEQMPPWDLPANATQSGILTRSSKGGSAANANALRFEDKKGAEQVWLHAEKNQDIEVEHDETHWVGHDRTKTIDHDEMVHVKHDRTETVDHDEKITVHHDRIERVDEEETISIGRDRALSVDRDKAEVVKRDKSIQVGGNHNEHVVRSMYVNVDGSKTETVMLNNALTVGIAMELSVGAALAITVGAAMAETVGGAKVENIGVHKTETVGMNKSVTVHGDLTENVSKTKTSSVEKDSTLTIGGKQTVNITKEYMLTAKKVQIVGEDEVNIKAGSAEIILKKNGDITIKGNKISIKGDGDVTIKGSKILEN